MDKLNQTRDTGSGGAAAAAFVFISISCICVRSSIVCFSVNSTITLLFKGLIYVL